MATPSEKSQAMNDFISDITGKDRVQTITNNRCMMCRGHATEFKDELSKKEYSISGLCQECQDKVFGK